MSIVIWKCYCKHGSFFFCYTRTVLLQPNQNFLLTSLGSVLSPSRLLQTPKPSITSSIMNERGTRYSIIVRPRKQARQQRALFSAPQSTASIFLYDKKHLCNYLLQTTSFFSSILSSKQQLFCLKPKEHNVQICP